MGCSSSANGHRAASSWVVGGLLVVGLSVGASGCAKIEARDLVREGNALYKDAKYIEAIEKYDAAEQLEPDGVTLFWNRACAAESQVMRMSDPKQREDRKTYADMALRDFQTWHDRVVPESEEERETNAKMLEEHRLNILNADERCDDLLTYWDERHRAEPKNENIYGAIIRQYKECDNEAKVEEWYQKRTEDFPKNVRGWHALAVRRFEPLWPDPDSGLAYNGDLPASERLKVADTVLGLLDKAVAIDPKFRDAYVWRSMAYTQRMYARIVVEEPEFPEEKLEAILAREDSMLAWKQQKAVCDLDQLPDCPAVGQPPPDGPCCPPPPLTPAEQAEDATTKAQVEAEIKAAIEGPAEEEPPTKGNKKGNKRGKGKR